MSLHTETSDAGLLALLREQGPQSITQLIAAMEVTATAVRQRLVPPDGCRSHRAPNHQTRTRPPQP